MSEPTDEPSLNESLRWLRENDPEMADRLERAIQGQHEDAVYAESAVSLLQKAVRLMADDLDGFQSPSHYVKRAVADDPTIPAWDQMRQDVALEYLARTLDTEAFEASGHSVDDYLLERWVRDQPGTDLEAKHAEGIRLLRVATKSARSARPL